MNNPRKVEKKLKPANMNKKSTFIKVDMDMEPVKTINELNEKSVQNEEIINDVEKDKNVPKGKDY